MIYYMGAGMYYMMYYMGGGGANVLYDILYYYVQLLPRTTSTTTTTTTTTYVLLLLLLLLRTHTHIQTGSTGMSNIMNRNTRAAEEDRRTAGQMMMWCGMGGGMGVGLAECA